MVKDKAFETDGENTDLLEIFMDNGSNQLEQRLLKSKRKLLNAKRGKNELFDILKLKLKGLDMLILILQNNKNIVKSEDIYFLDTLGNLLKLAKNDKTLFDPIAKKIKTIVFLILKNQIILNKEEKFEELCKFIVDIMNLSFEHSFLQQVVDKIKSHENIFEIFVRLLFTKFFVGRNVSMKANDIKSLIKYTMNSFGPFYFFDRLSKFLLAKENGGARTTHQISQVFNLLTYTIDFAINKLKDENSADFNSKFITLENENILNYGKQLIHIMKENLVSDAKFKTEKEEKKKVAEAEKAEGKKKKKKDFKKEAKNNSQFFFVGLINFYEKYLTFLNKTNLKISECEKTQKNIKSVANVLEKAVEDLELKNMQKKILEIKEKLLK